MARTLREVPTAVARQAMINKTFRRADLEDAAKGPAVKPARDLQLLASNVPAPELLPLEYAYIDLYADGRGRFYIAINDAFYRRSTRRSIQPA